MTSNKGFFVPTIMFFIFMFLITILILSLNSLRESSTNNLYIEQAKEETMMIKSNKFIENNIKKDYEEACSEEYVFNYENYTLEIDPICFFNVDTFYTAIIKDFYLTNELELGLEEYNEELEKIYNLEKSQKIVTKNLISKILGFLEDKLEDIPEAGVIIRLVEKKLDNKLEEYIAYDISIKNSQKENNVLYFFNFKSKEKKKILHT